MMDPAQSRLDVGIDDLYLDSLKLAASRQTSWLGRVLGTGLGANHARVDVPAYDLFGSDDLQFYFDTRPPAGTDCTAQPGDLRMAIDPASTLDLSRGYRFAQLPNLAWFVSSGFPFSRLADLSQTAVVVPDHPSAEEIGAFLSVLGRIGAQTGIAATRLEVVRPGEVDTVADRDLLVIGTVQGLQQADALLSEAPVRLAGDRVQMVLGEPLDPLRGNFGDTHYGDRTRANTDLSAAVGPDTAVLVGAESPLHAGRSVVALLAGAPRTLARIADTLDDSEQAALVQGDLSVLSGGKITSYRVGPLYTVGTLPPWIWPSWALRDQPLGLLALAAAGSALLGWVLFQALRSRARSRRAPRVRRS